MESAARRRYKALPLITNPWEQADSHHPHHGTPTEISEASAANNYKSAPIITIREDDTGAPAFRERGEASSIELFYDLFFVANLTSFTTVHAIDDRNSKAITPYVVPFTSSPFQSAADFFPVASIITIITAITSYIGFFAILWFTWLQVVLYDVRFGCDSLFERLCKLVHFGAMVTFAIIGT
ncbi:MAG: hypothetical protein Q9183_007519, partial [Haloplaca sp. 2 TL-2023]